MKSFGKDLVGAVFLFSWIVPTLALVLHLSVQWAFALGRGLRRIAPGRRTARVPALRDRAPTRRTSLTIPGSVPDASPRPRLESRWKGTHRVTSGAC